MGRVADTSGYSQSETDLWEKITDVRTSIFHTMKGLEFRITIAGNELFVDRRKKSITRASVNIAYRKWLENPGCGPKTLGVFGASYLWGIFRKIDGVAQTDNNTNNQ